MSKPDNPEDKSTFPFRFIDFILSVFYAFSHSWKTLPVRIALCATVLVYLGGFNEFLDLTWNIKNSAEKTVEIFQNQAGKPSLENRNRFSLQLHDLIEKTAGRKIFRSQ